MKTKYQFIHFEKAPKGLGLTYCCYNNETGERLGDILYDRSWRQYVMDNFEKGIRINSQCHRDIADFLDQLNKGSKKKTAKKHGGCWSEGGE